MNSFVIQFVEVKQVKVNLALSFSLITIIPLFTVVMADNLNPGIYSKDSSPFGVLIRTG